MSRITTTVALLLMATAACGQAKEDAGDGKQLDKQIMELKDYLPEIHGTIRGKYEFQTETNESRFEVRNARFSVSGNVHPIVAYKADPRAQNSRRKIRRPQKTLCSKNGICILIQLRLLPVKLCMS